MAVKVGVDAGTVLVKVGVDAGSVLVIVGVRVKVAVAPPGVLVRVGVDVSGVTAVVPAESVGDGVRVISRVGVSEAVVSGVGEGVSARHASRALFAAVCILASLPALKTTRYWS